MRFALCLAGFAICLVALASGWLVSRLMRRTARPPVIPPVPHVPVGDWETVSKLWLDMSNLRLDQELHAAGLSQYRNLYPLTWAEFNAAIFARMTGLDPANSTPEDRVKVVNYVFRNRKAAVSLAAREILAERFDSHLRAIGMPYPGGDDDPIETDQEMREVQSPRVPGRALLRTPSEKRGE